MEEHGAIRGEHEANWREERDLARSLLHRHTDDAVNASHCGGNEEKQPAESQLASSYRRCFFCFPVLCTVPRGAGRQVNEEFCNPIGSIPFLSFPLFS